MPHNFETEGDVSYHGNKLMQVGAIVFGKAQDVTLSSDGSGNLAIAGNVAAGFVTPKTSADADAPNNSIYYSTDAAVLVYKDALGVVNALY